MSDQWDELRNDIQRRDSPSILMWCADVLELLDERDILEKTLNKQHECDQRTKDWDGLLQQLARQQRAIEVLIGGYQSLVGCVLCAHHWGVSDAVRSKAERILKGEE